MQLRRMSFLMLVLWLSFALAACGSPASNDAGEGGSESGSNAEGDEKASAEDVDLRIVTMFGGTDPATEVLESQLQAFMDEHPNVNITNESMTSGDGAFRTKVKTDFSSGNEPDVTFFFTGSDAKNMIEQDKVVSMDQLLEADQEWASGFSEAALNQMREDDGNLYAIPVTGFYEGLIVNKTLFEDQGLALPKDWETYEEAIQTFAQSDLIPIAGSMPESYYLIEHYILSAGGPEGHNATFANGVHDSWAQGLNKMKEHYEMGAFPRDSMTINDVAARDLFATEQAAMMINGSWAIGGLPEEVQEHTTVLPMPVMPEGDATYGDAIAGFSSGYYLSTKAYQNETKKEAAVALIKYLTSQESIKAVAKANGGVPAAKVEVPVCLRPLWMDIKWCRTRIHCRFPSTHKFPPMPLRTSERTCRVS